MTLLSTSPPLHSAGSLISALKLASDIYRERDAPLGIATVPLAADGGIEVRAWRDESTGRVTIELHEATAADQEQEDVD